MLFRVYSMNKYSSFYPMFIKVAKKCQKQSRLTSCTSFSIASQKVACASSVACTGWITDSLSISRSSILRSRWEVLTFINRQTATEDADKIKHTRVVKQWNICDVWWCPLLFDVFDTSFDPPVESIFGITVIWQNYPCSWILFWNTSRYLFQ